MAQIYELFDGSGPGAYFFFHAGGRKWVVADLDEERSFSSDKLVRFDVADHYSDLSESLDRAIGKGRVRAARVGDRVVMAWDDALLYLKQYGDDIDRSSLAVFDSTGEPSQVAVQVTEKIADIMRKFQLKHTEDDYGPPRDRAADRP